MLFIFAYNFNMMGEKDCHVGLCPPRNDVERGLLAMT